MSDEDDGDGFVNTEGYIRAIQARRDWELEQLNRPVQQADRILIYLSTQYSQKRVLPPSPKLVQEQVRFMSKWPVEKLIKEAIACTHEDMRKDPEYYTALAKALKIVDRQ